MRDTTQLPLTRAIATLALPAALGFVLQNLYHVNDAWFLGRYSAAATSAMGLFMIVQIMNFGVYLVIARGTQSLVGRRFGAGRRDGAARALAQGLGVAVRIVLPLALLEWVLAPHLFTFMGGEGAVVEAATEYLRAILPFLPFFVFQPILDFSFQALGDAATPFRLQCVAVVVNLVLNALLVLEPGAGLELPVPAWLGAGATWTVPSLGLGVAGAAVATGVSRALAACAGFVLMRRRAGMQALVEASSYRADGPVIREILRVGLPAGASTFLYAGVAMALSRLIGRFGQESYGGYAIGFRGVESLSFMIVLGFATATSTVAAHAVGALDLPRARRAGHVGAALASGVMLLTTALMLLAPRRLAGFYTDDPAILAVAVGYITAMAACQVPQALEIVYADAMAGAGSTARAALVAITGNALRIPLAYLLAIGLGMGLDGVWYAIVASAIVKGLAIMALFLARGWEDVAHGTRAIVEAGS